MSWSISKLYETPAKALDGVAGEVLPDSVKTYIRIACEEMSHDPQYVDKPVLVHGHGHLMSSGPGGGSYPVTTARLAVLPMAFGTTLTLPLQVT